MFGGFKLKAPLGRNYNADPGDTLGAKKALNALGYYQVPKYGITEFPDEPLFSGIESFQRANDLRVDGYMRPDGPTQTAMSQIVVHDATRGIPRWINFDRLSGIFDRVTNPDFHGGGGGESTRCCATGTCDIIW